MKFSLNKLFAFNSVLFIFINKIGCDPHKTGCAHRTAVAPRPLQCTSEPPVNDKVGLHTCTYPKHVLSIGDGEESLYDPVDQDG